MLGGLVGVLALGLSMTAWAQDVPWKGEGDKPKVDAPAPGAPAAPAEGATPAPAVDNAKLEKVAGPVKDVLAQIEKVQKLLDAEIAKPDEKRDAKKILGFKESIARLYLSAAARAKGQAAALKPEEKQPFLDQYEKPNRGKAISILMELANEALGKKDFRNAEALAKQVLVIDPTNTEAQELLKRIVEEKTAAAKSGNTSGGGTRDQATKDKMGQKDYTQSGRDPKTDYGKTGRGY
jgi:hypothetical protein